MTRQEETLPSFFERRSGNRRSALKCRAAEAHLEGNSWDMEHSPAIVKRTSSGHAASTARSAPAQSIGATTHPVLSLQRVVGNRAVQRLIQTGVEGTFGQDAERTPGAIVNETLNAPGEALDPTVRTLMESRFGVDFGGVRVHTDAGAAESAGAIQAHAYTSGQDVVFAQGRYAPGTAEGQRLLAHELTHVVQQAAGPVAGTPTADGSLSISDPEDAFEQAADAHAGQVMGSAWGDLAAGPAGDAAEVSVQRDDDDGPLGGLGSLVSGAGSAIASGAGSVMDAGANLVGGAVNAGSQVVGDLTSGAESAVNTGAGLVGDVANAGSGLVGQAGSAIWNGVDTLAGIAHDNYSQNPWIERGMTL
jgi:Domain of unknown function (DUF4157)